MGKKNLLKSSIAMEQVVKKYNILEKYFPSFTVNESEGTTIQNFLEHVNKDTLNTAILLEVASKIKSGSGVTRELFKELLLDNFSEKKEFEDIEEAVALNIQALTKRVDTIVDILTEPENSEAPLTEKDVVSLLEKHADGDDLELEEDSNFFRLLMTRIVEDLIDLDNEIYFTDEEDEELDELLGEGTSDEELSTIVVRLARKFKESDKWLSNVNEKVTVNDKAAMASFTHLDKQLEDVFEKIETHNGYLEGLKSDLRSLWNKTRHVDVEDDRTTRSVTRENSIKMIQIEPKLQATTEVLEGLQEEFQEVKDNVFNLKYSKFPNMEYDLRVSSDAIHRRVDDYEEKINRLEGEIFSLDTKVCRIDDTLSHVCRTVDNFEESSYLTKTTLSEIHQEMVTLKNKQANLEMDLFNNKTSKRKYITGAVIGAFITFWVGLLGFGVSNHWFKKDVLATTTITKNVSEQELLNIFNLPTAQFTNTNTSNTVYVYEVIKGEGKNLNTYRCFEVASGKVLKDTFIVASSVEKVNDTYVSKIRRVRSK